MIVRKFLICFALICVFTILTNVHNTQAEYYAQADTIDGLGITPTPTMAFNNPCKAVVTYSWNISGVPNANRVFWELKKDSDFTNLEGREPGRLAGQSSNNVPTGSVTLDLRDFGQVLNGTKYYFRVVAKNGTRDVARRSASVLFDLNQTPDGTFNARITPQDPNQISVDWSNLQADIKNCSDHMYYEVKRGSNFTNFTGQESQRVKWGPAPGNSTSTTINLSDQDSGDYYARIVGKYGCNPERCDVGKRGNGIKVTIGDQAAPFQPVNITTEPLEMTGLRGEEPPSTQTQP